MGPNKLRQRSHNCCCCCCCCVWRGRGAVQSSQKERHEEWLDNTIGVWGGGTAASDGLFSLIVFRGLYNTSDRVGASLASQVATSLRRTVHHTRVGLGWVGSGQLCQLTPMRSLPFRSVSYLTHCGKTIETNCRNGERNKRNKPFVRCHFSFPFLSLFLVQYSAQARHIRGCCYYDYYCIRQFECRHPFLNRRKETVSPLSIYLLFSVAYRFISGFIQHLPNSC